MTTRTHSFIELSDLKALRLECHACGSSIVIPLESIDRELPFKCPNCGDRWGAKTPNLKSTGEYIADLTSAVRRLRAETEGAQAVGFVLSLEIDPPRQ